MPDPAAAALVRLAALPGVPEAVRTAREDCAQLRWHPAMRRRAAEVRAEAQLRAACDSAALEGAVYPMALVRDLARGAAPPRDPTGAVLRGAVRVSSQAWGVSATLTRAPLQALAALHLAAAADLVPAASLGRPRAPDELPLDGPGRPDAAPRGPALAARLDSLVGVLAAPAEVPALLVAAVVHGELLGARPFRAANGLLARAVFRAVIIDRGLDPLGVVVPEAGHREAGPAYPEALAGYLEGTPEGVAGWIRHCAAAVTVGAAVGRAAGEAVLAGRPGAG